MTTNIGTPTLAAINQRNAQFWAEKMELVEQRIADEGLLSKAMSDLGSEQARGVSVYSQKTFEAALEDAADAKAIFQIEHARKGGKAPKADPLQVRIQQIAQEDLQITAQQLWHRLRKEEGQGVIVSVDPEPKPNHHALGVPGMQVHTIRKIHFRATDGKVKTAPISGLKHRLLRARKKIGVSVAG